MHQYVDISFLPFLLFCLFLFFSVFPFLSFFPFLLNSYPLSLKRRQYFIWHTLGCLVRCNCYCPPLNVTFFPLILQGQENDIILISLVRSNQLTHGKIGYLSSMNRLCVAISRARCGLYLFGNHTHLAGASKKGWKVGCLCAHLTVKV